MTAHMGGDRSCYVYWDTETMPWSGGGGGADGQVSDLLELSRMTTITTISILFRQRAGRSEGQKAI